MPLEGWGGGRCRTAIRLKESLNYLILTLSGDIGRLGELLFLFLLLTSREVASSFSPGPALQSIPTSHLYRSFICSGWSSEFHRGQEVAYYQWYHIKIHFASAFFFSCSNMCSTLLCILFYLIDYLEISCQYTKGYQIIFNGLMALYLIRSIWSYDDTSFKSFTNNTKIMLYYISICIQNFTELTMCLSVEYNS